MATDNFLTSVVDIMSYSILIILLLPQNCVYCAFWILHQEPLSGTYITYLSPFLKNSLGRHLFMKILQIRKRRGPGRDVCGHFLVLSLMPIIARMQNVLLSSF